MPTSYGLDVVSFYQQFFAPQQPVVLRGCIDQWPALSQPEHRWDNLAYLDRGKHYLYCLHIISISLLDLSQACFGIVSYIFAVLTFPMLCCGICMQWSAMAVLGLRTVPVEMGQTYLSPDSSAQLCTVGTFLRTHICGQRDPYEQQLDGRWDDISEDQYQNHHRSVGLGGGSGIDQSGGLPGDHERVAYLAQHRLLDQVPSLRRDVVVPDYCSLLLSEDETELNYRSKKRYNSKDGLKGEGSRKGEEEGYSSDRDATDVVEHVWLGPIGTVSPLHHDPQYNLLAQVAGMATGVKGLCEQVGGE